MKKITKTLSIILFVIALSFSVQNLFADAPPDPGGGGPGGGDQPVGGGTPLSGGLVMLISMGVAYGFKKVYNNHKKDS